MLRNIGLALEQSKKKKARKSDRHSLRGDRTVNSTSWIRTPSSSQAKSLFSPRALVLLGFLTLLLAIRVLPSLPTQPDDSSAASAPAPLLGAGGDPWVGNIGVANQLPPDVRDPETEMPVFNQAALEVSQPLFWSGRPH
jgi:hypothetical protein